MAKRDRISEYAKAKAVFLDGQIDNLESRINRTSNYLEKILLEKFLSQLNIERGKINDIQNSRTISQFNQAYAEFENRHQIKLINSILKDIRGIVNQNKTFYIKSGFDVDEHQNTISKIINRRLGIDEDNKLIRNGYMQGLLDDKSVKNDIQKFIFKHIYKGTGYEDLKAKLNDYITGNPEKLGVFQKFYRTYAYDTYAQIDSYTGSLYAQKLGLKYFIYGGGLIATSRKFCIERNNKVFSTEEAEQWYKDPELTAIEDRASYNWLLDRGGYNCRHRVDWVAKEYAYRLRPELKPKVNSGVNLNIDFSLGLKDVIEQMVNKARKVLNDQQLKELRKKGNYTPFIETKKGTLYSNDQDYNQLRPHEIDSIRNILKLGYDYYTNKNIKGEKSFDGILFRKYSYKPIELKTTHSLRVFTIQKQIESAGKQSKYVFLDVKNSVSINDLGKALFNGLNSNNNISRVTVLYKGKEIIVYRENTISKSKLIKYLNKKLK